MEELFWEHREKGCGAKRSASSNKEFFLKIATHVFMKKRLIAEEAAWGIPRERLWRQAFSFKQ
ncbi:hypothetical protein A6E74_00295 [Enterococcus thailandicus]|uniref:Uncharacterized protein n=1 Tax=Enterococcus thailandicus TaxID=417368 RepID=A0A179EUH1_ENTTH|nr:hypothetical protein A6E74_00295 [Enterococcus thailandicus]